MSDNRTNQNHRRQSNGHGPMHGVVEKPKDFNSTMKKMLHYLKPYRAKMIVVIAFAVLSTVFTIITPKILGKATNQLVDDYIRVTAYNTVQSKLPKGVKLPKGTTGETLLKLVPKQVIDKIPSDSLNTIKSMDMTVKPIYHMDAIFNIAVWLMCLYILSAIFGYIQGWIMANVTQDVTYKLRE